LKTEYFFLNFFFKAFNLVVLKNFKIGRFQKKNRLSGKFIICKGLAEQSIKEAFRVFQFRRIPK
jgi:hypothetical protein